MFLSDISIKRPVFITMVTLVIAVMGWISYSRMAVDLFPELNIPVVVVRTIYPGATPQEVETLVSKPIEQAVSSLGHVESVSSTSSEGISVVMIEFSLSYSIDRASDDVRQRVAGIKPTLPVDVLEPAVLRYDASAAPIMMLAVADKRGLLDPYHLRQLVDDDVVPILQRAPGVASVTATGGLEREIQVNLFLDRLQAVGLPVQQVVSAVKGENINIPGGRLLDGDRERLLRLAGQFTGIEQLRSVPIATPLGATVYLSDVSEVVDGYKEVRSKSRLNGKDGIILSVRKQSGTNTVSVADELKHRLAEVRAGNPDLELAVIDDQSTFTRESTEDVLVTLIIGGLLAALVVFVFFRSVRNTLVTVAGMPIIVMGSFWFMSNFGFSLNMISLLGLSLSIGMLVDDAIVVRENIFRHTQEGEDPRVAASKATGEIALAVTATTLTIVVVFAPIAFTGGIAGKFLREFGVTVVIAVMLSLFEAFTLAPMLSALFFRPIPREKAERAHRQGAFGYLDRGYRRGLGWALRHRGAVVLIGVLALVGSVAIGLALPRSFIRDIDRATLTINLETSSGSALSETDAVTAQVEKIILAHPDVKSVVSRLGSEDGSAEKAALTVSLRSRGLLNKFQAEIRPRLAAVPRVRYDIDMQANSLAGLMSSSGSSVLGRPVQINLRGDDLETLDKASRQIADAIAKVPGLVDVDRSLKAGRPELQVIIDRPRAADLGISTAQVGATVRTLVNGERASRYTAGGSEVDIMVRLREADRANAADIESLPLLSSKGRLVPLSAIAKLEPGVGPSQITRSNRERSVTVGAGYMDRQLGEVVNDVRAEIAKLSLPSGVTVEFGGTTKYMESVFSDLLFALLLSVLFVYMILASQFGSFIHPFTIMLALPLSFVGAFFALYITGQAIDMVGLIGLILLMGLVTKNSILLVDYTNTLRGRGMTRNEAVLTAGPVRLRPIMMTTIATIIGMTPIALGYGAGGEVRKPMAIAVIGGIITSTLLTLVVVPVAYTLIDDLGTRVGRLVRGRQGPATVSGPAVEEDQQAAI
ncbi:MAG: efflux RND transporter permease subunit [Chloroflexota bacterium]